MSSLRSFLITTMSIRMAAEERRSTTMDTIETSRSLLRISGKAQLAAIARAIEEAQP